MKGSILALLSCCAAMLASPLAGAEIYRWTDAEGHVHFGDKLAREGQPGQPAAKLAIEEGAGKTDPDAERNREQLRALQRQYDAQHAVEASNLEAMQRQNQRLQEYCKCLRNSIRSEQRAAVMFSYDDAGKRVSWTAEERAAYRARLQDANRQYCAVE